MVIGVSPCVFVYECVNVIRKLQESIKWMNNNDNDDDRKRLTENENVTKHSDSHAISKACLFYPVISHYILQ